MDYTDLEAKSFSQFNQELHALKFYRGIRQGYFLDLGAYDGKDNSNTHMLEHEMGWTGLCVEPLPWAFEKLQGCRNVPCIQKAIFNESGLTVPFIDYEQLSGMTSHVGAYREVLDEGTAIEVETVTLNDLLEQQGAPDFIHFISLDTEGTELDILKSIDFDRWTFGLFSIEHNFREPQRTQIREFMMSKGFALRGENNVDDDYVNAKLLRGELGIEIDPAPYQTVNRVTLHPDGQITTADL